MKKSIITLLLTVTIVFAFSLTCLAAGSPTGTVAPTQEVHSTGEGGGGNTTGEPNTTDTSPATGNFSLNGTLVLTITALGIAVVSMKKYSECK